MKKLKDLLTTSLLEQVLFYLLPLFFSTFIAYGIISLLALEKIVLFILINLIIAYVFGVIYKFSLGTGRNWFDKKNILGGVFLSIIFVFMVFISSPVTQMSFVTFIALFIGAFYYGYLAYWLITTKIEEVRFSGFANLLQGGWQKLMGIKLIEYLGLLPLVFFTFSYLLLENLNVYGDEALDLLSLRKVLFLATQFPNVFYKIKVYYLFNLNYPPLFFLLSTPFLKFFHDWVVGGRVYVLLIGVLNILLLYYFLKKYVSTMAALVGCAVLVCSFSFINASRTFGHEIILLTFLLAVLIFMSHYKETGKKIFLFIAGTFVSLGMLSKYNFIIYATVPVIYYLGAVYLDKKANRKPFVDLSLLALPSILFASPFYIYSYITSPVANNVLSRFFYQKSIGRYESNVSIISAFTNIWQQRNFYFSDFVYWILAILGVTFITIWVIKLIRKGKSIAQMGDLFWMPLIFILVVTLFLKLIGLILLRWNLSYIFIPIVTAYIFDKVFYNKRFWSIIAGTALYSFLVLLFLNVAIRHTPGGGIFRADVSMQNLLPNPRTTGAKEVVEVIKDNWLANSRKLEEPMIVGFIGHIHEGLHGHALAYYGAMTGFSSWTESDVGILGGFKPTNMSVFTKTDYLVYIPNNQYNYDDPAFQGTLGRYQWIIENAPASYKKCTRQIGVIDSRFGNIVVLKINHPCLTKEAYFDLIETGRQFDSQRPSFQLFWDVEELRYKLVFKLLTPSEKNQACKQIQDNINSEKDSFSNFYFSLAQNNLAEICSK